MSRAVLITNIFSHYRRPLYQALLAHPRYEMTLAADADSAQLDATIATWMPEDRAHIAITRSRALCKRLIWQSGALTLAASSRYDIVIFVANMNSLSTWLGVLVARLRGKRTYFWAHGWRTRAGGLSGLLRRWFFSLPDGLLMYGRRARAIAIENGFDPARVQVIYNSLDYPAQRAARLRIDLAARLRMRESLFGASSGAVVACSTRLVRLRRLDLLFEAVAQVRQQSGREIRVLLVGDGPERPALEALAARLEVPVHFAGACYDEERMGEYLTTATCTVAPGMVGLSAMHSLAFGVPVLTHGDADRQMPEAEAVVEGLTGGRFRLEDVADLARAIGAWTRSDFPDAVVAAACVRVIERFYNPASQLDLIISALDLEPARATAGEMIQPWELAPDDARG